MSILKNIHCSSHMGPQLIQDLVHQSHIIGKDANSKTAKIVKNFKSCQLTNVVANERNPTTQYQSTKPVVYQKMDFMEIKSQKTFRYKYFLILIDTFSGEIETFATKDKTV